MAEGSIWEAFEAAAFHGLDNLTAIIDVNRLGQTGETMHGWDLDALRGTGARPSAGTRSRSTATTSAAIDGAMAEATGIDRTGRPSSWRGPRRGTGSRRSPTRTGSTASRSRDPEAAIAELGGIRHLSVAVAKPSGTGEPHEFPATGELQPAGVRGRQQGGHPQGVRRRAGGARRRRAATWWPSTARSATRPTPRSSPRRTRSASSSAYIAEQQMVAIRGRPPGARLAPVSPPPSPPSCRAPTTSCAWRAVSRANIVLDRLARRGEHRRGRAIADGARGPRLAARRPRQHRALSVGRQPGSRPAGRRSADREGIVFMRTTREKLPVIYPPGEAFADRRQPRSVRQTDDDQVTLVGAGITLHEAIEAADLLGGRWHQRPRDRPVLGQADRRRHAARRRRARPAAIITVEDHWPEGGLGDAVLEVFAADAGATARSSSWRSGTCRDPRRRPSSWRGRDRRRPHRRGGAGAGGARDRRGGLRRRPIMNTLQRLHAEQDQSPWIDFIDRQLIDQRAAARSWSETGSAASPATRPSSARRSPAASTTS